MGTIRPFTPEKLVVPFLAAEDGSSEDTGIVNKVIADLETAFGPIDYRSSRIIFDFTSYYEPEMGSGLIRRILGFRDLVSPDSLAAIKTTTNELEQRFAGEGNRRVNLDPGLLSLKHLILASTKDNGRRVPLRAGIYAEITLVFYDGDFHPIEWTYPDYRSREYRDVFGEIRSIYRDQLRERRTRAPR